MKEVLNITGTDDTPTIRLDKKNNTFLISGRSMPEDSSDYYLPVLTWLDEYAKEPNATTKLVFKLEYFNTASSKYIQDILTAVKDIKGIEIEWYYIENDEDMEATGQEFSERTGLPFLFKTF